MKPLYSVARFIALLNVGLIAGIIIGDRMGASVARPQLEPSAFVQLQQIIHRNYVVVMPVLLFSALAACVLWLISVRAKVKRAEFWLVGGALVAVAATILVTLIVNVPINEIMMTWDPAAPPADVHELWEPWERAHSARSVLAPLAFILLVLASGVHRRRE